ncbi:MAG: Ig-like domain-containing protein [Acetatifactor sp.]|nr:Ig-like domain-containing protein [Acetatifactor sp.]
MKRVFGKSRRLASALLTIIMIITSVPQTGIYASASNQTDTEAAVSSQSEPDIVEAALSQSEPDIVESASSQDGTEPGYAVFSEAADTGEYLIDDTLGFSLTDVVVTPGSYNAHFSAKFKGPLNFEATVLYTEDKDLADSFFSGVTKTAVADATALGFIEGYGWNLTDQWKLDENGALYHDMTWDLDSRLTPETTYYYRIVYKQNSESMYYFLSVPGQFTTGAPVEVSSVKVSTPEVEEVGYNWVKVVWTVDNPNNEYICEHYLRDPGTYQAVTATNYRDESGREVPGKYCATLVTKGGTLTLQPELKVYTGTDGKTVTISCEEPLTVEAAGDIGNADITVRTRVDFDSFRAWMQITPWYEIDDGPWLKVNLYYRVAGETEWQTQSSTPYIRSGMLELPRLNLDPGTYEYYMELIPNYATECIWNSGSETEPLSFTIENIDSDSLFPDETFRNFVKKQVGISEEEKLTSAMLDKVKSLHWSWADRVEDDNIQSLEGIQYMENLTTIEFPNHALTNADQIQGLTKLQYINLNYNLLDELPDLSGMPDLRGAWFRYNKILSGITADKLPAGWLEQNPSWLADMAKQQCIKAERHSQDEIKAKYAVLPYNCNVKDTYAEKPNTKPPYATGRLSDVSLQNALNVVNLARYVAGVPSDVKLNESYSKLAQAGALVNCVNNEMSHTPEQPDGFPDDLYEMGYKGCSSSNLGFGFWNSADSIVRGYLYDSDMDNIGRLGHRAWALSPALAETGFGSVDNFFAMHIYYAMDNNGGPDNSDFVAWPAQNMPVDFMTDDYAWSVELGNDYRLPKLSEVTVTMKETSTGKSWTFNQGTSSWYGNFFHIVMGTIIFRPEIGTISYKDGSQFEITISNLKDRAGNDTSLNYTVNFFALGDGSVDTEHDYSLNCTELKFDLAEGTKSEILTVYDGQNIVGDVSWSSEDESVATVSNKDGNGIVTPKGSGSTRILAKVADGSELVCQVTVENNKLTAISLNLQECTLEKGAIRRLRAYLSPSDSTLSKELLWTSDKPEVASVDASGMVTALSKGTAVITVSTAVQGTASTAALTAQCTVTVYETATPAEDNIPSGLRALTNVQTKLSNVSLKDYEGWEWENGDISLAQFAGQQEKSFMAVYRKDGYADYRTALNVSLATLTGISITADKTVLGTGGTAAADIQWKLSGLESVLSGYADTLQWSSSNPAVLTVTVPDAAAQTAVNAAAQTSVATGVTLRAGTTPGKATVTAQITLGDKTYTARQTFTVVDGAIAEFGNITMTDGFTETTRDGNICYEGRLEDGTGTLAVTVTNATKLTVKSSNAKVLSAGKIQVENGNISTFRIPLTMKAAGMAKLTLTANDAAKSKTEILCYVRDARPNLDESTVTVNKLRTDGAALYIYPNDGYVVTGCELGGADAALFETLTAGKESDSYCLKAKKSTAKGSYKLTVKVTTAASNSAASSYELPLTVKVTEQAPKYKIKQSAKANIFYSDLGTPRLTITSEETLTGLTLMGCDFKVSEESGTDAAAGVYTLVPDLAGTLTSSCNTKGTLMLTFEGYETISTPFTVGIENKKPKLALGSKTITLYPNVGVTDARLQIKSGNQILSMEDITATLRNADSCILTKTDNELTLSGADLLSGGSLTRAVTIKAEILLTCHGWAEEIILPLTVKADPGKPALKLQKSTLQLNAGTATLAYDMAETEVLWKNGACFDSDKALSVSAVGAKSQEVIHDGIVFEQTGSKLIARLNNRSVAAGTYKFKVHAPGISAAPVSLTIKVVNTDLSKAVKLSAKGSIDVLNRAGSCVTVTPSLKSLNGQITDVKLSGDFAHLFRAELNEKNQIVIHAKETDDKGGRVALITKYNYDVNLVLTAQNAEGETMQFTTPAVRLKLKQSKPKVAVMPKSPVFFSGAYNSVKLDVAASLKGAANPEITDIELVNQTDLFDYSNGVLTLRDTGTAVKGKSYSLQLRVTFRDQADNEKATIVKVNAKVK